MDRNVHPTSSDSLHITMHFLGRQAPDRLTLLVSAGERAVASTPPFQIEVRGVGGFPSRSRPAVIWLGATVGGAHLEALANAIRAELQRAGIPVDGRQFLPHCTVARVHGELPLADSRRVERAALGVERLIPCPLPVGEVHLMESIAVAKGANRYQSRHIFPLAG